MTCIVSATMSKATFKKLVHGQPALPTTKFGLTVTDPSIFAPYSGSIERHPTLAKDGGFITVTNHPKRNWFAQVTRKGSKLVVA